VVRIATWNVNSLKVRLPRVEEWLEYAQPDVLCMQETKMADAAFPTMPFAALGYETAHHGSGQWNGVAILSRVGIEDVAEGFGKAEAGTGGLADDVAAERRLLAATCGGVRVTSVYVPNGRSLDNEQYRAKLDWLDRLARWIAATTSPDSRFVICGDFNIAPDDRDVYDPRKYIGTTHTSEPERAALQRLLDWGLGDAFRVLYPQPELFTWWDYRAGDFHNHRGMRIDLMLMTAPLLAGLRWGLIDRNARKGKLPSDHAPMLIDVEAP
jgi:exodeoxyribonuclease-3